MTVRKDRATVQWKYGAIVGTGKRHIWERSQHAILTLNVGGSREALILVMETDVDLLLFQEHRIAGPHLPGIQGLAMGKGWYGVWGAATSNGNGRSCGMAVLARRPVQIMRGGRMRRGTIAVIAWPRRSRLQVASTQLARRRCRT